MSASMQTLFLWVVGILCTVITIVTFIAVVTS